jgi:hypothetical protein
MNDGTRMQMNDGTQMQMNDGTRMTPSTKNHYFWLSSPLLLIDPKNVF